VASLRPGRGRRRAVPGWRPGLPGWRPGLPGLTSHRTLSGATATMWHWCGPDRHDVASWRSSRGGRAGWRGRTRVLRDARGVRCGTVRANALWCGT